MPGIGLAMSPGLLSSSVWSPRALAPTAWFRSDVGVTQSGSTITRWADMTGNGHDMTNGAWTAPTYSATWIPYVDLDSGSDGLQDSAAVDPSASYYLYIAMNMASALVSWKYPFRFGAAANGFVATMAPNLLYVRHGASNQLQLTITPDSIQAVEVEYVAATTTARGRVNGGAWTTQGAMNAISSCQIQVGDGGAAPLGRIYEVALFPAPLTAGQLAQMRAYSVARYGV